MREEVEPNLHAHPGPHFTGHGMPNHAPVTRPAATAVSDRTMSGDDFVAQLRTNPNLAMSQLMNFSRASTYDTASNYARTSAAVTHEQRTAVTPRAPRSLSGGVAVHRPATSATRHTAGPDLTGTPTRRDLAALCAAEELSHELLATGFPTTLAEQAKALAFFGGLVADRWSGQGLDRRGPMFADAASLYLTRHAQPTELEFSPTNALRKWYGNTADAAADAADAQLEDGADSQVGFARDGLDTSFISRRRIVWTVNGDPADGILLDRFHPAHRSGAVTRDRWAHAKVAADLSDAEAFLAPAAVLAGDPTLPSRAILGVRVLSHLAPGASAHFVPTLAANGTLVIGGHHPLGGCRWCTSTAHLPNADTVHASTGDVR